MKVLPVSAKNYLVQQEEQMLADPLTERKKKTKPHRIPPPTPQFMFRLISWYKRQIACWGPEWSRLGVWNGTKKQTKHHSGFALMWWVFLVFLGVFWLGFFVWVFCLFLCMCVGLFFFSWGHKHINSTHVTCKVKSITHSPVHRFDFRQAYLFIVLTAASETLREPETVV